MSSGAGVELGVGLAELVESPVRPGALGCHRRRMRISRRRGKLSSVACY